MLRGVGDFLRPFSYFRLHGFGLNRHGRRLHTFLLRHALQENGLTAQVTSLQIANTPNLTDLI